MTESKIGSVAWPPAPIKTERLVLRQSEARDRAAFVDLLALDEVNTYLGGAQPRDEVESKLAEVPGRRHGVFVVERDGAMIGTVELSLRPAEVRATFTRPDNGEAELGYLFLPHAWGHGYAAEACAAALDWFTEVCPGEPVVLATQTANKSSMRLAAKLGFTEVTVYHAWGAEQWMGKWAPSAPSA